MSAAAGLFCQTSPSEEMRLRQILEALGGGGEMVVLGVDLEVSPKLRHGHRAGGGGFAHAEQTSAELALGRALRIAFRRPLQGNIALAAIFYRRSRQAVDYDNLLKTVGDAGNGIVFADDRQVTAAAAVLELDRLRPRTLLAIAPHASSLRR